MNDFEVKKLEVLKVYYFENKVIDFRKEYEEKFEEIVPGWDNFLEIIICLSRNECLLGGDGTKLSITTFGREFVENKENEILEKNKEKLKEKKQKSSSVKWLIIGVCIAGGSLLISILAYIK